MRRQSRSHLRQAFSRPAQRLLSFSLAGTLALMPVTAAFAQSGATRVEGLRDNTPRHHAITGARLVIAPGKVIDNGVLVMKDGRIVAAGADVAAPPGARVWNLPGRIVYPGFIDLAGSVGVPAAARARPAQPSFQPGADFAAFQASLAQADLRAPGPRSLSSANRSVRADFDVAAHLELKADELKGARDLGFTAVLASPMAGTFRGQSALINTADKLDAKPLTLLPRAAQHAAIEYERGFGAGVQYPNSAMGAIALIRQTLYDARWQKNGVTANGERVEPNATLDALRPPLEGKQPVIFAAEGEQDFRRIANIRDEFGLRVIALGNGYEYRRVAQLRSLGMPVIVPLNFPTAPEVETPDAALDVPLEHLQHWEHAPSNAAYLAKAGVEFAFTANGLRDAAREFWPAVRQAVKRGLAGDAALAALTTTPAKLIGVATQLGTLEPGRLANVVVANGDLFAGSDAEIELTFIDGRPHAAPAHDRAEVRGIWTIAGRASAEDWVIAGTRARPTLALDGQTCDVTVRGRQLVVATPCGKTPGEKTIFIADVRGDAMQGAAQSPSGVAPWSAVRKTPFVDVERPGQRLPDVPPPAAPSAWPAGSFGMKATPAAEHVIVKNATVWTSAATGKLVDGDVIVKDGKIAAVGRNLATPPGASVIDARGKHVTPGMIDAHSHTAVAGGINESTSSVTAEVRIGDVIDATNISMYRQLAGGTTAANVLHGSANTIGGQSQTLKFRWGAEADGLKFAGAAPGIKFALGENVKQSNMQTEGTRYPQTRMGVEQILRDAFSAARTYQQRWAAYKANPKVVREPRRDLQLDTLAELLEKKRAVHIHSYRADEILMFARVAKELGIPVATFQHVLEGYKVADAIRDIGAGASSFSDWWAYKMEVADAIPYNGAIMHKVGVLTTFNSDSDELARRLNTEAAKAVRYGGVSETEALKFVTINAAKQLGIDGRTGSIEAGKDADFVIWSADPLSPAAVAEQTWVDGRRYYDLVSHRAMAAEAEAEKRRLVAKALPHRMARVALAVSSAGGGVRPESPPSPRNDLQDLLDYMRLQRLLHMEASYRGEYWNGGNWHECTEDAR
ncbi:MAG: amidohydrolase family protein [Betaproteobacteria bacterium]|nr:amidohydrolase family protein [Betaproteobacteria bacterium]